MTDTLDRLIAEALLGVDTLWGGDVMAPSGTGRFIADTWFSDEELPRSYTHEAAARVRSAGGLSAEELDREALDAYLSSVDVGGAIAGLLELGPQQPGLRGEYLAGLGLSLQAMWDLAMEELGRGDPVGYAQAVIAATGEEPTPSDPAPFITRLVELLADAGYPADSNHQVLDAVESWRRDRALPPASIPTLSRAFIAELDAGTLEHLLPHLPPELHEVPRANVEFFLLEDVIFSGAMNYVGRARDADGRPLYEATYEINASLEMSIPEFVELVSHEVVPGHCMNLAYLQHLYHLGRVGFEATVLAMNTRICTLSEGIANNAALIACGVTELDDLPDRDVHIGLLLARLQDEAKNQAAYSTWQEKLSQPEVAEILRRDFLLTHERAEKISGPWAHHPLLGRMYLPAYRAGTELVERLRREHPPEVILPALFGCNGLVDAVTIHSVL